MDLKWPMLSTGSRTTKHEHSSCVLENWTERQGEQDDLQPRFSTEVQRATEDESTSNPSK